MKYMICDNCGAERMPPKERCEYCGYKLVPLDHRAMGSAEFRVVCSPAKVKLVIHDGEVVAECSKEVYGKLFDYCVGILESDKRGIRDMVGKGKSVSLSRTLKEVKGSRKGKSKRKLMKLVK